MSNLIAAAKARNVRLDDLRVDVQGTLAAAPHRLESIALSRCAARARTRRPSTS